ncbi:MAG: hypothetical protein NT150_07065 [Bacteroidetes bacterium]|nr:hypothetical protein [Bacteroidota bacterium]
MYKLLFVLTLFITMYSCKNEPVCAGIAIHQLAIKDTLEKAIVLDTFYTVSLDKPDTLRIKRYMKDSLQYYPLIDDSYYQVFSKQ